MTRLSRKALIACVAATPMLSLAAAPASAEERVCRGTIGATTVDNLRVPDHANCVLLGTRVKGTIKVEYGATLRAEDVVVIGNVQGENAKNVRVLDGSRIGGSIQVKQGGAANVSDSRVEGDIQYDSNSAKLWVLRNRVGGSVQVFQNVGGVEIRRNTINGNLQCKANSPAPVGGRNVVGGNKEDQCARL
jgi:hypothetical protein